MTDSKRTEHPSGEPPLTKVRSKAHLSRDWPRKSGHIQILTRGRALLSKGAMGDRARIGRAAPCCARRQSAPARRCPPRPEEQSTPHAQGFEQSWHFPPRYSKRCRLPSRVKKSHHRRKSKLSETVSSNARTTNNRHEARPKKELRYIC
eukprot:6188469-Pleurochrysis_carterae.AAC.2